MATLTISRKMINEARDLADTLIDEDRRSGIDVSLSCFYSISDLQGAHDQFRAMGIKDRDQLLAIEFPEQDNSYLIKAFEILTSGKYYRVSSLATGRGVDAQNTVYIAKEEFKGDGWVVPMFSYAGDVGLLRKRVEAGDIDIYTWVYDDAGTAFQFAGMTVPEETERSNDSTAGRAAVFRSLLS
jgi:hypothetical protein